MSDTAEPAQRPLLTEHPAFVVLVLGAICGCVGGALLLLFAPSADDTADLMVRLAWALAALVVGAACLAGALVTAVLVGMGWTTGLEPATSGTTSQRSTN